MPVVVTCPNGACSRALRVPDKAVRLTGRCKHCGRQFVPSAVAAPTVRGVSATDDTPGPARSPAVAPRALPERVGRFRVLQELGEGGFGVVYRAADPHLDREVAVKVLKAGVLDNPAVVERFRREAKAAARLRHPAVVPVFEVGAADGVHYIASEYVPGRTLAAAVPVGGMAPRRAAGIVRELAEAVAHAHVRGVVHRDIKPANVILDDRDWPHLLDFGLAARSEDAGQLTTDGAVVGTPAYMAPEQTGGRADPAADQYALGVLLYELLTGRPPFAGPPAVVLFHHTHTPPPPPSAVRTDIPRHVEAACLKALAKTPANRFPSVAAFAAALDEGQPTDRPVRRRAMALAGVVAALIGAAGVHQLSGLGAGGGPEERAVTRAPLADPDAWGRLPVPPRAEIDAHRRQLHDPDRRERLTRPTGEVLKDVQELRTRAAAESAPSLRYALFELARDFAADAGSADLALQLCGDLAARFAVANPFGQKAAALATVRGRFAPNAVVPAEFVETVVVTGMAAAEAEELDAAERLAELARSVTGRDVANELDSQAGLLAERVTERRAAREWVSAFDRQLALDPSNITCRTRVGEYECLFRDDWGRGLDRMTADPNPAVRAVVAAEADRNKSAVTAAECTTAGDAWWALAEAGDAAEVVATARKRRAKMWYLKALGRTDGPERAALAKRVVPRIDAVPLRPVCLRIRLGHVEGNHVLRLSAAGLLTTANSHGTREVRVNRLRWGGAVGGRTNAGADSLFPEGIDFSTARVVRTSVGRWGRLNTAAHPDRFDLVACHPPAGACDFEVTVCFEADGYTRPDRFVGGWEVKVFTATPESVTDVRTDADWDRLFAGEPVHRGRMERPDFRDDQAPLDWSDNRPLFLPKAHSRNHYALTATTEWELPAGKYELRMTCDDGVRVAIDDEVVTRTGHVGGSAPSPTVLAAGKHRLRIDYFQLTGPANLTFWLRRVE